MGRGRGGTRRSGFPAAVIMLLTLALMGVGAPWETVVSAPETLFGYALGAGVSRSRWGPSDPGSFLLAMARLTGLDLHRPVALMAAHLPLLGVSPRRAGGRTGMSAYHRPGGVPTQSGQARGGPLVLIYHTHTSESFVPTSGSEFSFDPAKNVVAVGDALARALTERHGLPVLHLTEMLEPADVSSKSEARARAYDRARSVVSRLLGEYPTIQAVLDIHRDAASRQTVTTLIDGRGTARVMLVVGSGGAAGSRANTNWEFARELVSLMEHLYPGMARRLELRGYSYNHDLHPRAVLVEIGSHQSTLEEACRTASLLADVVAGVVGRD